MIRVVFITVVIFAILFALYVALDTYMRGARRRELESDFAEGAGGGLTREDFIDRGMAEYRRSADKKILMGVFAIPIVIILALALLAS